MNYEKKEIELQKEIVIARKELKAFYDSSDDVGITWETVYCDRVDSIAALKIRSFLAYNVLVATSRVVENTWPSLESCTPLSIQEYLLQNRVRISTGIFDAIEASIK